jgi:hypothetical protein
MEPQFSVAALLVNLLPLIIVQAFYAWVEFLVARKRGLNPWPWVLGTLVPLFGMFVFAVFFLLTLLSILDRLNRLEKVGRFD